MSRAKTSNRSPRDELFRRFAGVAVFLAGITALGTVGLHEIGKGVWSWADCLYMTVITLSTVGYGEVLAGFAETEYARAFTTVLIILGGGTVVYAVSSLTAFIVEGDLLGALRRNRMEKRIESISGHLVVCGVGSTGGHLIRDLVEAGKTVVAVDTDEERLQRLDESLPNLRLLYVVGDATDDHTLQGAGVENASGLMAALHDDKDNVYVTISARALNPDIRIVSKSLEQSAVRKLRRAGADKVVSPYRIGARRMVGEMIRPGVVEFFDEMLHTAEQNLKIEEVKVPPDSPLVGCPIRDTQIREVSDALVLAMRSQDGVFSYNPGAMDTIDPGSTLILLGDAADLETLRVGIKAGSVGRRATP